MHWTEPTFRPPFEAQSLILQVTQGCSHNACSFCAMYRDTPFRISPIEEVEEDLEEFEKFYYAQPNRVFLEAGDAFCLPTERLVEIAELIHKHAPCVKTIGGYASIHNIRTKSDEDLKLLAELGYADFNIGVESALDDVLEWMNKGYDSSEARYHLFRMHAAKMPFNINIINAAAGPRRIREHADANAAFINDVRPTLVFATPLHVDPGTPLQKRFDSGEFEECTLGQYLEEEIRLLEGIDVETIFFGLHMSNPVPLGGMIPRDKEEMIRKLWEGMNAIPQSKLDSHPRKGFEGRPLM